MQRASTVRVRDLLLAEHGRVALQRDDARAQRHPCAASLDRVDQRAARAVVAAERAADR